jgi:hypothetical protein
MYNADGCALLPQSSNLINPTKRVGLEQWKIMVNNLVFVMIYLESAELVLTHSLTILHS